MQFLTDINRYPNREANRKLYKGKGIIELKGLVGVVKKGDGKEVERVVGSGKL